MRSPAFDTFSQDHHHEESQQEAVLPGLVGSRPRLQEKGRPDSRVIAHGYVSRGGTKRGRAETTDDANQIDPNTRKKRVRP